MQNIRQIIIDDLLSLGDSKLTFVRHGQTDFNKQRVVQGGYGAELSLNDEGNLQVVRTSRELMSNTYDIAFTSPATRAIETASIMLIMNQSIIPIKIPELREIDWGVLDNAPQGEEYEHYNKLWLVDNDFGSAPPEGEDLYQFTNRMRYGIHYIVANMQQKKSQHALIAGHGFFFGILFTLIRDSKIGLDCKPKNGQHIVLEVKQGKISIELEGEKFNISA